MHAHYFQHVPFEGLGSIERWLQTSGFAISSTRFFETQKMPRVEGIDFLVVLGGPMSANDVEEYPWLVPEKQFIHEMVSLGKPVLGICLGAQLIASAMGAAIYKNDQKEIGWFPIQGVSPQDDSTFGFPSSLAVFHWHGERFDLPPQAIRLAKSPGCANQAFQLGRSVIGLQFHLETTPSSMAEIVAHCRDELVLAPYVQSESEILSAQADQFRLINETMDAVLAFLLEPVLKG